MSSHSELSGYTILRKIGSGTFSQVFKAVHKKTRAVVAIKVMNKSQFNGMFSIQNVRREAGVMASLHHPSIAEFYELRETEDKIYLVVEFVEGSTLLQYVNGKKGLSDADYRYIFGQLVLAISYMHGKNIAHRDIKAENVMINKARRIKLIDFGFSKPDATICTTICGSLAYCAPELISHQKYTLSVDIWSLGVVLYSMVKCLLPFRSNNSTVLLNQIMTEEPDYDDFPVILADLIKRMLTKDPRKRITMQEIHDHPLLKTPENIKLEEQINERLASYAMIDACIVEYMQEKGISGPELIQNLQNGIESEETIAYRILRRTATCSRPSTVRKRYRHTQNSIFRTAICDPRMALKISPNQHHLDHMSPESRTSRENVFGLENQYQLLKPTHQATTLRMKRFRNSGMITGLDMSSVFKDGMKNWKGPIPHIRQRILTFEW